MSERRKDGDRVDSTRRRLVAGLAAAPLIGLPVAGVLAGPAPQEEEPESPAEEKSGPHRAEAGALMVLVSLRYGSFLDQDGATEVRESIERSLGGAKRMTDADLANREEPDFVFTPFRREDGR